MQRTPLFRTWKLGVLVVAAALLLYALIAQTGMERQATFFFAALVLIASFLRIEAGDVSVGFEAAIAFGALIIFHSPAVAFAAVLLGGIAYALIRRTRELDAVYNAAQLALSYGVVSLPLTPAAAHAPLLAPLLVAGTGSRAARGAAFFLRSAAYAPPHLFFVPPRRYFEEDAAPLD